ncbi:nucleotide sugar dehydrogenase [Staphylococcus gallinarum]|jgi:UDP-N-acetyl-D-galactosamine dehydrogenase|uniref:nucleotide sugar dehydrogenase n=1 Tax=Staphylococcus gallinarum TaxID=1293 RepID=UPI000D1F4258|nr:nucleotide sugar dehydrogenase [Staphylococcus gallinarum]MCD8821836.1 nucleotide sugar dehydrogenase [Staphylococcus gallinarum]MCD8871805.1 nucleotide sugar dehydrogenase [Staphylococcus gallinarum]MCQ9289045.1 nucleotide sugar dehydrogenase [Staphylococcus gallinarum]MCW0984097.1 nucleotide sugar dehydrogenase [Staphylococcus gallinarum]MEB6243567.1 nucleotide sugar dehydrogenase [Staphylococcus gallinarum]
MDRNIAVVGLGYVGLPVAVSFGNKHKVIGFDINEGRISELKNNYDRTNEVTTEKLEASNVEYTSDRDKLSESDFIIVAVPTPIDKHNKPNLTPLIKASETVGSALKKGSIIVYESTVYPGATEEECVPVLEKFSGLECGKDFFIGYSPERINPGDKEHTFETITKVVSGQTPEVLEIVAEVYDSVVKAGVYKASSIKVAEAAKVIENTQRDVNIALMNELAIIFDKLNIDTNEVLKASGTKWNFLNFKPGLVGGHCIGVDPYYLTHKAQEVGHHPEVILSGRRINDNMAKHIASNVIKEMLKHGLEVQNASVNVLGLTFKENCPDLRNTKVIHIIEELASYGLEINVNDVEADKKEAKDIFDIDLKDKEQMSKADVLIFAVSHKEYLENKSEYINLVQENGVIFDIKGVISDKDINESQRLWRL